MASVRDFLARRRPRPAVSDPTPGGDRSTGNVSPAQLVIQRTTPGLRAAIQKLVQEEGDYGAQWQGLGDFRRILQELGERQPLTQRELDEVSYRFVDASAYDRGFRLWPGQAEGLVEFQRAGGLLAQLPVGEGKTLLSLLIASWSYSQGAKRILLLIPPDLGYQLLRIDLPRERGRVPLSCPFHSLLGRGLQARELLAKRRLPGCYIMPYSQLSTRDARDLLAWIEPEVVICDEAHVLKHESSARTDRLLAYLRARPETRVAFMSGTLTTKSILDYHHLMVVALGKGTPAPIPKVQAEAWASVLDAASVAGDSRARELKPLLEWARSRTSRPLSFTVDGYREAYRTRLRTAPGVLIYEGGADAIGCSLYMERVQPEEPGVELRELDRQVLDPGLTPSGDVIEYAIHAYYWRYCLSAGFYYDLRWPSARAWTLKAGLPEPEAARQLERAKEHHAAKQLYNRDLREFLMSTSIPAMDTPMLVGAAISRGDVSRLPASMVARWKAAKELEWKGMPERESIPVRVDDFKLRAAVKWARGAAKRGGAILWVHHKEVGEWLYAELVEAGLEPLHAPAGRPEQLQDVKNADRIFVASIGSHHRGKNLQHFHQQLVVQWPRPADVAEQMLGRIHRNGQKMDEVTAHVLESGEFDEANYAATLNDAFYAVQTTGLKQRVIYATYRWRPKIYRPSMLERMGFAPEALTGTGLEERFGAET